MTKEQKAEMLRRLNRIWGDHDNDDGACLAALVSIVEDLVNSIEVTP